MTATNTWEQITVELTGTPRTGLGDRPTELRREFMTRAFALSPTGQLTGGAGVAVAVTRIGSDWVVPSS